MQPSQGKSPDFHWQASKQKKMSLCIPTTAWGNKQKESEKESHQTSQKVTTEEKAVTHYSVGDSKEKTRGKSQELLKPLL